MKQKQVIRCGNALPATEQKPLLDWNNQPIALPPQAVQPIDPDVNPLLAVYGPGPDGKKCGECAHIFGTARAKTYWKCDLRTNTHGSASDHRRVWPACGKFVARHEPLRFSQGLAPGRVPMQ